MKKFEFLDFATADVVFKAYGKDLNELFSNAALAMFEVMINTKQVKEKIIKEIELKTDDLESLMFSWLNELLFYVDAESLAFSRFDVSIEGYQLKAKCYGEKINTEKHETRTEIKATTYHKMKIKKEGDMWIAQIIVDV